MTHRLFLASRFAAVTGLFREFAEDDLRGKTVVYIPTASIPYSPLVKAVTHLLWHDNVHVLARLGLTVTVLEISTAAMADIECAIRSSDYIFVAGGNTFFLLHELRRTRTDALIREHVNSGRMYIGESAGAIVLAPDIGYVEDIDDRRAAPDLGDTTGLEVLDFYPLPHQGMFGFIRIMKRIHAKFEQRIALVGFSNTQALLVTGAEVRTSGARR